MRISETAIPTVLARRRLSGLAETVPGVCASAACYCGPEDIGVKPVVVAELKFRDVERQIFAADLVEAADNAALQQRPEAIDGLSVNNAIDVLTSCVPHELMREMFFQSVKSQTSQVPDNRRRERRFVAARSLPAGPRGARGRARDLGQVEPAVVAKIPAPGRFGQDTPGIRDLFPVDPGPIRTGPQDGIGIFLQQHGWSAVPIHEFHWWILHNEIVAEIAESGNAARA
jgi:hypothetical protein